MDNETGFLEGVAWAAAVIIRLHDQPGIALGLLREAGTDIRALENIGVNEYDLSAIRAARASAEGKE